MATIMLLVLWCLSLAHAEVPQLMNYQGAITDNGGTPITGTFSLTFSIYDSEENGTILWSETHSSVSVNGGIFSVLLGSITPLPGSVLDNVEQYLGITIVEAGPELTPRTRLVAVPYAFQTGSIDGATGGYVSRDNKASGFGATISGGGGGNITSGLGATISGGGVNSASGVLATVAGRGALPSWGTFGPPRGNWASDSGATVGMAYPGYEGAAIQRFISISCSPECFILTSVAVPGPWASNQA